MCLCFYKTELGSWVHLPALGLAGQACLTAWVAKTSHCKSHADPSARLVPLCV